MGRDDDVVGGAGLHLVGGARLLHPREQVFEAMVEGWRNQRMARNLADTSVDGGYQVAIRGFCGFITDPAYGWAHVCEEQFGTHPIQVLNEVNSAAHVADSEADAAKRAVTRDELQALFDHADDQVAQKRALGRKGWLSAFRDVADFGRNPDGPEFGEYGVCYVRYGKAQKGSPPKRRSVLTIWAWTAEILEQWFTEVRPLISTDGNAAALPSERGIRVGVKQLNKRLGEYREALGLDPVLDFHSLRRSYVTHLIEDGWDPRFVQEQVGHDHASTTSIYTCVSSDYRVRTLRRALDATPAAALGQAKSGGRR